MGRFFKIFPNLSQNWLKPNKKILEKSDILLNFWRKILYERDTFSWKIGICMGLLSNFVTVAALPYQNQTRVGLPPPPPGINAFAITPGNVGNGRTTQFSFRLGCLLIEVYR